MEFHSCHFAAVHNAIFLLKISNLIFSDILLNLGILFKEDMQIAGYNFRYVKE